LIGRPTSSSMASQAFREARSCLRVIGTPPTPSGVPSMRPSMWDWPVVRMTIRWSAPCQAAIRMRRTSSSNRPDAISVVTTQLGWGSMCSKYSLAGSPAEFFSGWDMPR
jgi:hypothetical protein